MYTVELAPSLFAKPNTHTLVRDVPTLEKCQEIVANGMVNRNLFEGGGGSVYVYRQWNERLETIEQWEYSGNINGQWTGWFAVIWHGMRVRGERPKSRRERELEEEY